MVNGGQECPVESSRLALDWLPADANSEVVRMPCGHPEGGIKVRNSIVKFSVPRK